MAKKMNDYQIIKCPHCCCEYYDSNAKDGDDVGDPKTQCPACGNVAYRNSILEPAIIGGNKFFEVRFASLYKKLRIVIAIFFAIFIVVGIVMKDIYVATGLLAIGMIVIAFSEIIKILHRNNFLDSDEYKKSVRHSLERLKDETYARIIIRAQGVDVDSVYYKAMYKDENDY